MRRQRRRQLVTVLAAAACIVAAAVAPARAGSPYNGGPDEAGPNSGPVRRGASAFPPARRGPAGLFSCSYREQRTKLERKNCGGTRL